jgi:hypothetical protein
VATVIERVEAPPSSLVEQLLGRVADADEWQRFERQLRAMGYCRQPVRLQGRADAVDLATGECRRVYSTDFEPGHPMLFVTLTAPSFGPVHSRRLVGGHPQRCRPRRALDVCRHGVPAVVRRGACRGRGLSG